MSPQKASQGSSPPEEGNIDERGGAAHGLVGVARQFPALRGKRSHDDPAAKHAQVPQGSSPPKERETVAVQPCRGRSPPRVGDVFPLLFFGAELPPVPLITPSIRTGSRRGHAKAAPRLERETHQPDDCVSFDYAGVARQFPA